MPPSANGAARAGDSAVSGGGRAKIGVTLSPPLTRGDGLSWIAYGIFITAIPLLTVGVLARMLAKMNYLTLCGMLAGSMTDPPALAFANNLHATSGAAALVCHRLSAGDVPAHYHPAATRRAVLGLS